MGVSRGFAATVLRPVVLKTAAVKALGLGPLLRSFWDGRLGRSLGKMGSFLPAEVWVKMRQTPPPRGENQEIPLQFMAERGGV